MTIFLLTGIQAAGKSTVAQALAERYERSVHLRGDVFRRMVVGGRANMGAADPPAEAIRQLRLEQTPGIGVWLDTSDQSVEGTVEDILAAAGLK